MNKSAKIAVAATALMAPIAIGWTYTAGASVGFNNAEGAQNHTIDEFEVGDHFVVREEIDGVVTEVVTGPDGNVVDAGDVPAEVADFLDDWTPPEDQVDFEIRDGVACYNFDGSTDGEFDLSQTGDDGAFIVVGADGEVTSAIYSGEPLGDDVVLPAIQSNQDLMELPGAVEMSPCE